MSRIRFNVYFKVSGTYDILENGFVIYKLPIKNSSCWLSQNSLIKLNKLYKDAIYYCFLSKRISLNNEEMIICQVLIENIFLCWNMNEYLKWCN